jgi:hypothetical protein
LQLDHSADFTGTVSGLASGNQLDLHDILFGASTTESYTVNQAGTGGTLTVSDGVHTVNIVILGQYSGAGVGRQWWRNIGDLPRPAFFRLTKRPRGYLGAA